MKATVFENEIGRHHAAVESSFEIVYRPEPSLADFEGIRRYDRVVIDEGGIAVDKFALDIRLEYISAYELRSEIAESEFLAALAAQGCDYVFAVVDMAADGRIPFAGLNIFVGRPFLQIDVAAAVDDVKMYDGMQRFGSAVTVTARGAADDRAVFVDKRQEFVFAHDLKFFFMVAARSAGLSSFEYWSNISLSEQPSA